MEPVLHGDGFLTPALAAAAGSSPNRTPVEIERTNARAEWCRAEDRRMQTHAATRHPLQRARWTTIDKNLLFAPPILCTLRG
jgi:hypothetical protein